jgi:hypothetical protein
MWRYGRIYTDNGRLHTRAPESSIQAELRVQRGHCAVTVWGVSNTRTSTRPTGVYPSRIYVDGQTGVCHVNHNTQSVAFNA